LKAFLQFRALPAGTYTVIGLDISRYDQLAKRFLAERREDIEPNLDYELAQYGKKHGARPRQACRLSRRPCLRERVSRCVPS